MFRVGVRARIALFLFLSNVTTASAFILCVVQFAFTIIL